MIDDDTRRVVRALLSTRSIAALATLHDDAKLRTGVPSASMVPFALHRAVDGPVVAHGRLVLVSHVSRLSAHTRDMLAHPDVCLLITGPDPADGGGGMPQAVPRVSIPCRATFVDRDATDHDALRATYLARFPDTADFFSFADFSLVAFVPTGARLVAGFARAHSLSAADLDGIFTDGHHPRA